MGRELQKYAPRNGYVFVKGEKVAINAQVYTISGYSAHADQSNLINFIRRIRKAPKKVIIVQGDHAAKVALASNIKALDIEVIIP